MNDLNSIINKTIRITGFIILIFIFAGKLEAQNIKFNCKLDSTVENSQFRYSITVNLPYNVSNCTISLFGRMENLNYQLIDKQEHISSKSYTFYTSERRKWMVLVESGGQNS